MPDIAITTKPGDKYRSVKKPAVYEALRREGYSKGAAARVSNAQARRKRRTKTYTLEQLEAFVCSPAYDPALADAIAQGIPDIPTLKDEQLAPGITRIRGNLCNVHGRYGRCPGAQAAPTGKKPRKGRAKKPRAAAKPKQTPVQRAAARQQEHDTNRARVLGGLGFDAGQQAALTALRAGQQPDAAGVATLIEQGLVEQAQDGSYRMTSSGRALVNAAEQGDAGRAHDTMSSAQDRLHARQDRQTAAAARRASSQMGQRERQQRQAARQAAQAQREREQRQRASSGGGKKKQPDKEQPRRSTAPRAPRKRRAGGTSPITPTGGSAPKAPKPPKPQVAPALQDAARQLSDGKPISDTDLQRLITNGLVRINTDGVPVLTAAGQRVTKKAATFAVFKDAAGHWRWVGFSSTAYQDRDGEIVSTKALAADCAMADATGVYGPLRWWHQPGLDLGDADFNAMHGRVLIESGTFRSEAIARKVAARAADLELSIGFVHPPTEPDAAGVFHHIRRFERSLVPRGKASNPFTSFHVKETLMDAKKKAALKELGFTDSDIADLETRAAATQKTADDQGVAFKAEAPPAPPQEIAIGGVTYTVKAPAPAPDVETPAEDMAEGGMEEPEDMLDEADAGGLTLSEEDLGAIGQLIAAQVQAALAPLAGLLDIEKKMQGHVEALMGGYTAKKDAEQAETKQQVDQLAAAVSAQGAQLAELVGDQPAAGYRPTQDTTNILTDARLIEAAKAQLPAAAGPFDDILQGLGLASAR